MTPYQGANRNLAEEAVDSDGDKDAFDHAADGELSDGEWRLEYAEADLSEVAPVRCT